MDVKQDHVRPENKGTLNMSVCGVGLISGPSAYSMYDMGVIYMMGAWANVWSVCSCVCINSTWR